MTKRGKIFFLIVSVIVFSSFISANTFYVNIPSPPTSVGQNFDVEIKAMTSTSDLFSVQFDVNYNPSVLTLNSINEGPFLSSDSATTIFNYSSFGGGLANDVYNVRNKTFLDSYPGITGDGVVAILNFDVTGTGTSGINLNEVLWVNSSILNDSAATVTPTITNGLVNIASPCTLTNAYWNTTNAVEGEVVELIVEGTNCAGQAINFTITDEDLTFLLPDDFITSFTATFDRAIWTTVYVTDSPIDLASYYFDTFPVSNPTNVIRSNPKTLNVNELNIDNVVLVYPPLSEVNQGQSFLVEVRARAPSSASDIYGLQFDLVYNPSSFTFNSIVEGDMLNEGGTQETLFNYTLTSGRIDDAYVLRNVTFEGSNVGIYDDEGTIAILNFTASGGIGVSNLNLENVIWVNSTIDNQSVGVPGINVLNGIVDVLFSGNYPPMINSVECLIDSTWQACDNLDYGETISEVWANCTDSDGSVSLVSFILSNTNDIKDLFNGVGTQNGDVWNYDLSDFALNDSGSMNLNVLCSDDESSQNTDTTSWNVPFGNLAAVLINPTENRNVAMNQFFNFTSGVTCVGGECGNVNALLDPTFGNNQVVGTARATNQNSKRCGTFYLSESGIVENISYYGYSTTVGAHAGVALYNSTATGPDGLPLLAQSEFLPTHDVPAEWNTYDIPSTNLAPGYYALCFVSNGTSPTVFYYADATGGIFRGLQDAYPFENPYGTSTTITVYNLSIYATYTTGPSGPEIKSAGEAVSTVVGTLPFYTIDSNPAACTNMKAGDYCETTWEVNATGENDTTHEFYTIYSQNQYSAVVQNETAHVFLTIVNGTVVVDNPPTINLISPADGFETDAVVTFNASVSDENIVNVSLYINGTLNETDYSGIDNDYYPFSKLFTDGYYSWYYEACDNVSQCTISSTRYLTFNSSLSVTCSDGDGDGYGSVGGDLTCSGGPEVDCNDGNLSIHPGASENTLGLCTDDVDNNCNNEADYDLGVDGLPGDVGCDVFIQNIVASGGSSFVEGTDFPVVCTFDPNLNTLDSIYADIEGVLCTLVNPQLGTYAFLCNAGAYTGSDKIVTCGVNLSRSYSSVPTNTTQIQVLPACTFTNASWSETDVLSGATVQLFVNGTIGCDGEAINFTVWEDDGGADAPVVVEPVNVNFVGSDAIGSWIAEWQYDGFLRGDPEYYFITTLVSNASVTLSSKDAGNPNLNVDSATPVCGDGVAEGTEQCDELDLNGASCTSEGYSGGTIDCYPYGDAQQCQFDYSGCFVDNVPVVNLVSPINWFNSSSSSVNFVGYVFDDNGLVNVSLYVNASLVGTNVSGINNSDYTFIQTLADDIYFWYYQACDNFGQCNYSETRYLNVSTIIPDTTAPLRSNGAPTGSLPTGTTQITISLDTDENAICKYSTTSGVAYASIPNTFSTTGATTHSTLVTGLSDGNNYFYYVRCNDTSGNFNTNDFVISFSVSSPPPCTDVDGDRYTSQSETVSCGNNCGGQTCLGVNDCNDGDIAVWQLLTGYPDGDLDTYYSLTSTQICSGASLPLGYSAIVGNDCNDTVSTINPGADDICNGANDDCNSGTVDGVDELWFGQATSCGIGVCSSSGILNCSGGVQTNTCVAGSPSGIPETVCNGDDDDCDNSVDEDYIIDASCGVGICFTTHIPSSCVGGVETLCQPGSPTGLDNNCNNVDENCNGAADDNYVAVPTSCGVGVCSSSGFLNCIGGSIINSCVAGSPTQTPETTCSGGLDEDCDGDIDCPDGDCATQPICTGCFDNDGDGYDTCNPGDTGDDGNFADCNDVVGLGENINPGELEMCNEINDDCNIGTVDGVNESDYGDATNCGQGVCASTGIMNCTAGEMVSTCTPGAPTGSDNDCNNLDENCNGLPDENYVTDTSCFLPGVCATGNQGSSCVAGFETACQTGSPTETPETTCSGGLDEDCDGDIDFSDIDCFGSDCLDSDSDTYDNCTLAQGGDANNEVDCNNTNSSINPGAIEICNGVDDDCDGNTDEDGVCGGTCTVTDMYWNTTSAEEDDVVGITIIGQDCNGLSVTFGVWEKDGFVDDILGGGDDPVLLNATPASFNSSGMAVTTWNAEWQDDGFSALTGDPEYYFTANIDGITYNSQNYGGEFLSVSLTERKWQLRPIQLNPGKNSLSLPLILDNYTINYVFRDILDSVEKIYTYDGEFKIRHFDGRPSNLYELELGRGYIIFMNQSDTLIINGTTRDENLERPTITLVPGWNFIGTFSNSYAAQNILAGVNYDELYTYNNNTNVYEIVNPTDYLEGERGYWIYVTESATFIPITGTVIGK